jgi:hypothetical protein
MLTMIRNTTLHKLCCCVCFVISFGSSCHSRTLGPVDNRNGNGVAKSDDSLYYLDNHKPSIVQPLEHKDGELAGYKFVQVEVIEVLNPKKYQLTFEVSYQSKSNEKTYLGNFTLYPSDNPGKFIVATQGKLKDEGAIILSLVVPDKIDAGDAIKVTVKKIKLLKG